MSKIEILAMAPFMPALMQNLNDAYVVHRFWETTGLAAHGTNIRAIATNGNVGAGTEVLEKLPAVEIISIFGVGVDAVDLAEAKRRGIAVTTTAEVLTEDVADQALALLLALSRKIVTGDQFVRSRTVEWDKFPLTHRVNGKKAGIFGLGSIGKALARRLLAMNIEISYTNRKPANVPYRFVPDLKNLAAESDFLIITASGGPASQKLVNAKVLDALGPDGLLINVARGSIIDEPALISALQGRKIAGAGLDVFQNEPEISSTFFTLNNVVLGPHAGSGTVETRAAMGDLVVDNLAAHFAGHPLLTPLTL